MDYYRYLDMIWKLSNWYFFERCAAVLVYIRFGLPDSAGRGCVGLCFE